MLQAPSPHSTFILLQRDPSGQRQLKLQPLPHPGAHPGCCIPNTSAFEPSLPLPAPKKHWEQMEWKISAHPSQPPAPTLPIATTEHPLAFSHPRHRFTPPPRALRPHESPGGPSGSRGSGVAGWETLCKFRYYFGDGASWKNTKGIQAREESWKGRQPQNQKARRDRLQSNPLKTKQPRKFGQ